MGCLLSLWGSFFMRILALVLHVHLHRSPQCPDVPLTEACGSPSFYQLQEEGVFCKDGLGKHLEEVPGRGTTTSHNFQSIRMKVGPSKSIIQQETFSRRLKSGYFQLNHPLPGLQGCLSVLCLSPFLFL